MIKIVRKEKEMLNLKIKLLLLFVLSIYVIGNVSQVYAQDSNGEVNLLNIPKRLANALNIPQYSAKLIASLVLTMLFIIPTLVLTRNLYVLLIIGFLSIGVCVAIGWLEAWYIIILVLIVASLWSAKMKAWLT